MKYIFRKSDGVHLATGNEGHQFDNEMAAIATNEGLALNELQIGETMDPRPQGHFPVYVDDDHVVFMPEPEVTARAALVVSIRAKLEGQGFTAEEAQYLGRG